MIIAQIFKYSILIDISDSMRYNAVVQGTPFELEPVIRLTQRFSN